MSDQVAMLLLTGVTGLIGLYTYITKSELNSLKKQREEDRDEVNKLRDELATSREQYHKVLRTLDRAINYSRAIYSEMRDVVQMIKTGKEFSPSHIKKLEDYRSIDQIIDEE